MRPAPQHYFLIMLIMFLLTACNLRKSSAPPTSTMESAPQPILTQPTASPSPTTPPTGTETPTLAPTSTSLPFVKVDGLRVAYIVDGNLYVQDSGGQPRQLTSSDLEDSFPIFSDDGEKIIFQRGAPVTYVTNGDGSSMAVPRDMDTFLINANGGPEQVLLPAGLLAGLNLGYDEATESCRFDFIPETHNLFFTTCQLQPWTDGLQHLSPANVQQNKDLLILNTDSMEIKQVLAPGKGGVFHLSPDKKWDMAYTRDTIDLVGTDAQIARQHMITYLPDWDSGWTEAIWSHDSSKFTFLAPMAGISDNADSPLPDTIWQYSVDKRSAVEIRLNPPPIGDNYTFSPDGNWVVYSYIGKSNDTFPAGLYLGNLRDGSSRLISSELFYGLSYPNQWSPDSGNFFFYNDARTKMYIANIQGDITLLDDVGFWAGWFDGQHYLYKKDSLMMGEVGKEGTVSVLNLPLGLKYLPPGYFTYVYIQP